MVVDVVDVDDDADNLEVPQWTHEHVEHDAATCRSRLADLLAINRPSCPDQPINQSINQSIYCYRAVEGWITQSHENKNNTIHTVFCLTIANKIVF